VLVVVVAKEASMREGEIMKNVDEQGTDKKHRQDVDQRQRQTIPHTRFTGRPYKHEHDRGVLVCAKNNCTCL
jgi:hypothetical protein